MKDLLIECRTALGLAKSMAERERYDTDVYTKRIEMIDKALRKLAVSRRSEQLVCDHPDEAIIKDKPTDYCLACNRNI